MNLPQTNLSPVGVSQTRSWEASLTLRFIHRPNRTVLKDNHSYGPLRVQRPFYPEGECCHIYMLHPPGGLVLGDKLAIDVAAQTSTHALLTTPSAGKVYGVLDQSSTQTQTVRLQVDEDSTVEWLPQETIVFNGANARLKTDITLANNSRVMAWDMVCLGRPASGEVFQNGRCDQTLSVTRGGKLLLLERNRFIGGEPMLHAPWGLWGAVMSGTFLATAVISQAQLDELRALLGDIEQVNQHRWGVTQKSELIIVRYLGSSSRICRLGFEKAWDFLRPLVMNKPAVAPRIWST